MKTSIFRAPPWAVSTFSAAGLLWLLSRNGPRNNVGYIDPNIYVGLALESEQSDILSSSYYSSRVVHIGVLRLLHTLFFAHAPQAYSFLVFAGIAALIYQILSALDIYPRSEGANSVLAIGLASLPPSWLAASWTYVNGTLWILVLIVLNCVLRIHDNRADEKRLTYLFVAGAVSVLAVNTHPKSLVLLAAIFGGAGICWTSRKTLKTFMFALSCGYVTTELLYQFLEGGRHESVWNAQVKFALRLAGAQGEWTSLARQWGDGSFPLHFLAPFLLAVNCFVLSRFKKSGWNERARVLSRITVLGSLALLLHQEVLRDPISTTFWYFSPYGIVFIAGISVLVWSSSWMRLMLNSFLTPLYLYGLAALIWPNFEIHRGSTFWMMYIVLGVGICRIFFELKRRWWSQRLSFDKVARAIGLRNFVLGTLCFVCISTSLWLNSKQVPSWQLPPSGFGAEVAVLQEELYVDQVVLLDEWVSDSRFRQPGKIWYEPDPRGYLGSLHSALLFVPTSLTLGAWPNEISATAVSNLLDQSDSWNSSIIFLAWLDERRPEIFARQSDTLGRVRGAFKALGCTEAVVGSSASRVQMLKFQCAERE